MPSGQLMARDFDVQDTFNFIQHFHRIANIAVHFVDESENRRIAQTAHTSINLMVRSSTPSPSITINTESTAVKVR